MADPAPDPARDPASDPAPYPTQWEADVLLRDGRPLHLRPITPDDADRLRRFHDSLSDDTIYYRFFAPYPELSDRDVRRFTTVDDEVVNLVKHYALLHEALLPESG